MWKGRGAGSELRPLSAAEAGDSKELVSKSRMPLGTTRVFRVQTCSSRACIEVVDRVKMRLCGGDEESWTPGNRTS